MLMLLAAIGALGSMAIHLVVPAMPDIAASINASPAQVQLAISFYLAGMAAGQLIGGYAADRVGRRPVILVAVALFAVASLGAVYSDGIILLIALRFLQAAGGGAAVIAARAILADTSAADVIARRMAGMMSLLLMSPALSPVLGGLLASYGGWRANFLFLAACGAVLFAGSFISIRETVSRTTEEQLAGLGARYAAVLRYRPFWRYSLVIACSSSVMFGFLATSPFLLIQEYELSPASAGWCYLVVALSGITGTFAVKAMERRGGAFRTGVVLSVCGCAVLVGCGLAGLREAVALIAPMLLVAFGVGMSAPAGAASILRLVEGMAGAASSLSGAFQMLAAGLTTTFLAQWPIANLAALGAPLLAISVIGLMLAPRGRVSEIDPLPATKR